MGQSWRALGRESLKMFPKPRIVYDSTGEASKIPYGLASTFPRTSMPCNFNLLLQSYILDR
jgi:hypothetical protein